MDILKAGLALHNRALYFSLLFYIFLNYCFVYIFV